MFEEAIDEFLKTVSEIINKMKDQYKPDRAYTLDDKRKKNPNAYMPWTEQDDRRLELLYCEGKAMDIMMLVFGRNRGAITSRIRKLELREKYG